MSLADRLRACDAASRGLRLCKEAGYPVDERSKEAVRVARRFAEGEATRAELDAARSAAVAAAEPSSPAAQYASAWAAVWATSPNAGWAGKNAPALADQVAAYVDRKVSA